MGSHSYPHLLFSRFLPPPLLPPRPYSINHCAFLSNFQPLRLYLDVLIKYSQCVPVLHFFYLLMIYLFVKRRGCAIILIALHLLVAFHVPYLLSSPRVLAYRRDGRCFWFSCCFSSFTHPLLLVFHFGSAAPLLSLFSCLASGLPSAHWVFVTIYMPGPSALCLALQDGVQHLLVIMCVSKRLFTHTGAERTTFPPKPPLSPAFRDYIAR